MIKIEGTQIEQEYCNALEAARQHLVRCTQILSQKHGREFVTTITGRIKTSDSIQKKLNRKGYQIDLETAVQKLNDIAGIRIICSYLDDVYDIREELCKSTDLEVVKEKDYIARPRKSGYRSLHMIVKVPVETEEGTKSVKVEIQIRTFVMHLWAELDHDKYYKKQKKEDSLYQTLKLCAKLGKRLDVKMQKARNAIELSEKAELDT